MLIDQLNRLVRDFSVIGSMEEYLPSCTVIEAWSRLPVSVREGLIRDDLAAFKETCRACRPHFLAMMPTRPPYDHSARIILKSLAKSHTTATSENSNGILLHGVYGKPFDQGVDERMIWSDYFYVEALTRLLSDKMLFW